MIDENIVKEAIKKMKGGKADVTFGFSSDCLMNGPDALYKHLASLFRAFLIHGQVASILLLCSLIPIVKNGVGDLTSSDNYRAIAKSALVLKVFDWVLLLSQVKSFLVISFSLDTSSLAVQLCVLGQCLVLSVILIEQEMTYLGRC